MSTAIRKIVVGVGSVEGDTVLPAGVELAQRLSAELHVVHTYEIPHPIQAAYIRLGMREPAVHRLFSERLRGRLQAEIVRIGGPAAVGIHAVAEEAGRAICDVAAEEEVDLVVLGATRLGALQKHILGSTADRVIRSARKPVLVLRPPFRSAFRDVVLTTDLSSASAEVVRRGLELVGQLAGEQTPRLRAVLAAFADTALPQTISRERLETSARRELERFLSETCGTDAAIEPVVRVGDPAREVVAVAASAATDLIVLGTHGRTGVSRYFLGSVAGSVLRSSPTSVLVIPHAALEETHGPAQGAATQSVGE